MKRTVMASFALVSLLAAGAAWWQAHPTPTKPDVLDLLAIPKSASSIRLLGASRNADGKPASEFEMSEDFYEIDGLRYLLQERHTRPDGSTIVDYFRKAQPDSVKVLTLVYGPTTVGKRPHLIQKTSFADDGTTKTSDVSYDLGSGLRTKSSILGKDGNYLNRTYFADGVSIDEEDLVLGKAGGWDKLASVKHFSPITGHLLSLSALNADGASRTVSSFDDASGLPVRVVKTGSGSNKSDGEVITAYFPGTKTVRLQSKTDTSGTHASFFRRDGTLEATWEGNRDHLTVTNFDPTGKKPVYVRVFDEVTSVTTTVGTLDVDTTTWKLAQINELGPDGKDARVIKFAGGKVSEVIPSSAKQTAKQTAMDIVSTIPLAEMTLDTSDNLPLPPPTYTYGPYGGFGFFRDH